jgi:transitional endoplasmic reticulum ATPase
VQVREGILRRGDVVNATYEIQFFIGEGAFGEVYRVKHKSLGLQVLKVLKPQAGSVESSARILSEARLLAAITNSNVVRVFETNTFERAGVTYDYLTTEFVSGESLEQRLRRTPRLSFDLAMSIQRDLLEGLCAAHLNEPQILHRDIHAENVLLSYEGATPVAKLSDFGSATAVVDGSLPASVGRYTSFAPECFWGTALPASDVFSAGIVFYRMLTGHEPWKYDFADVAEDAAERTKVVEAARRNPPAPPSVLGGVDKSLDSVLAQALSTDMSERYADASSFLGALVSIHPVARACETRSIPVSQGVTAVPPNPTSRDGTRGFDGIAGMEELKDVLYHDVILPLRERELYEQYRVSVPNGMLLYGPPGCGKTFIARKFAEEVGYNFVELKPSDLASIYVHGTQQKIGSVFDQARAMAPTILFLDEIDALVPNRESDLQHSYAAEVNEFLAQMTNCHEAGIFIIAASNRPERIDPAILRTGRLDKLFYLGPPDHVARSKLFQLHFEGRPVQSLDYDSLAERTDGYVASDIAFIVNEAARDALRNRENVGLAHVTNVISRTKPSVSTVQLLAYTKYGANGGRGGPVIQ